MTYSQSQHSSNSTTKQDGGDNGSGAGPMQSTGLAASSKVIATLMILAGFGAVANSVLHWADVNWLRLSAFAVIGIVAAMLKVKLPGMDSTMSVNLPFILLAAAELSLPGVLIVACLSTLTQSLWRSKNPVKAVQIAFNLAVIAVAAEAAWFLFHFPTQSDLPAVAAIYLSLAAAGYFVVNTVAVAAMVASVQRSSFGAMWGNIFTLTFPYYVLSAGLAVTAISISRYAGWYAALALLVVMFGVYSSYKRYFGHREPHAPERSGRFAAGANA